MLVEVKKCADMNDIKGLRYIFIDSLDVDPTFEKYRQDYNYCKSLSGFFDEYVEMTGLKQNKLEWDATYWNQLKRDLVKNFSQIRFEHMIQVAKIVYSEKIERLVNERATKKALVETQIASVIPTPMNIEKVVNSSENSCSADFSNSTVNKQSPASGAAAKTYKMYVQGNKTSARQQKFITIYNQSDLKIEVSEDLTALTRYSPLNGRTRRYDYRRVINTSRIRELEGRGYKWIVQNVDLSKEYFVLRQVDIEYSRYTGVIKIVKITNATVKQWATTRIEASREIGFIMRRGDI